MELNSKLHELCRELRKENALLLDTSKAISAQELTQRKALTENFQVTVSGITVRYASSTVNTTLLHLHAQAICCQTHLVVAYSQYLPSYDSWQ